VAFSSYIALKYPGSAATGSTWSGSSLTWELVKREMDAARPMVFLVDSSGDGRTDHFVTIVGYRESNGYPEYACWDTWSTTVLRWQQFRPMSSSYSWGVWGAYTLSPGPLPEPEPTPTPTPTVTPTPTPTPTVTPSPTPTSSPDLTAPLTTATGFDGLWHNTAVTVTFSATDDSSGVASTAYSIDDGSWARGTSLTISVPRKTAVSAVHMIRFHSTDAAGNVEAVRFGQVKIDAIKPVTRSNADAITHPGSFVLVLEPADADSGVTGTYLSVDGGAYRPAVSATITGRGRHTVRFYSVDAAGNAESTRSATIRIG
jgi:hypothetical protein